MPPRQLVVHPPVGDAFVAFTLLAALFVMVLLCVHYHIFRMLEYSLTIGGEEEGKHKHIL